MIYDSLKCGMISDRFQRLYRFVGVIHIAIFFLYKMYIDFKCFFCGFFFIKNDVEVVAGSRWHKTWFRIYTWWIDWVCVGVVMGQAIEFLFCFVQRHKIKIHIKINVKRTIRTKQIDNKFLFVFVLSFNGRWYNHRWRKKYRKTKTQWIYTNKTFLLNLKRMSVD